MQEQILVPLDGSGLAEGILPIAASLACATGRALNLVRVIPALDPTESAERHALVGRCPGELGGGGRAGR